MSPHMHTGITIPALLACLLVALAAPGAQAPAVVTLGADACRVAPTPVLDPLNAFAASLARAETQAFNMGSTACLLELTAGSAQASALQWVSAARAAYPGMAVSVRAVVATAAYMYGTASSTPGVCPNIQAIIYEDAGYGHRVHGRFVIARHDITAHRSILTTSASAAQGSLYVAIEDQAMSIGPAPDGASGAFAGPLASAVNRYLTGSGNVTVSGYSFVRPQLARAIARNGFVIDGHSGNSNFFGVDGFQGYDSYGYNIKDSVPSFITVDAGLHTFHVLFDRTLMSAEVASLRPRLQALLSALLATTARQRTRLAAPPALAANAANAAYVAVPLRLLGGALPAGSVPASELSTVAQETALVMAHARQAFSPFLGQSFDYRLFTPRGHYTYGPDLESYFMAMNWLALMQAPLEARHGIPMAAARAGAMRAVLLAALMGNGAPGTLLARWHRLADPISALIGAPAGPALPDILALLRRVYGTSTPSVAALQSPARLAAFLAHVRQLPAPPYHNTSSAGAAGVRGFGLFPARTIADGSLAAALTWPHVGTPARPRTLPSGLDVMAALGSARARTLVQQSGHWPGYNTALKRAVPAFQHALRVPTLYAHWLAALRPLARPMPRAAPPVMHTVAWADKELMTGLASWSELRHDSILYASQFGGLGGGGPCQPVELYRQNYVEPIPSAWAKLAALADQLAGLTRSYALFAGLTASQRAALLGAEDTYRRGLHTLAAIANVELMGRPLNAAQQDLLGNNAYAALGDPMATFFGATPYPQYSPQSTQAAEIADVATDLQTGRVLEVGEGSVRDIWVLLPIDGWMWLALGQVYTYYEFTTAGQRLTDQQWQHDSSPPREPAWIEAITR